MVKTLALVALLLLAIIPVAPLTAQSPVSPCDDLPALLTRISQDMTTLSEIVGADLSLISENWAVYYLQLVDMRVYYSTGDCTDLPTTLLVRRAMAVIDNAADHVIVLHMLDRFPEASDMLLDVAIETQQRNETDIQDLLRLINLTLGK